MRGTATRVPGWLGALDLLPEDWGVNELSYHEGEKTAKNKNKKQNAHHAYEVS
jgi:hypothetical protein